MRRTRYVLLVLLALIGLASVSAIGVSDPRPEANAHMPMMNHHHGQQPPANANDTSFCSACTAVLPPLPLICSHVLPPVALFPGWIDALSGIHVGLDRPPPRFGERNRFTQTMKNSMKKLIAAIVLLSSSTAAFASAPAVAKAITDCTGSCPGCAGSK